MRTSGQNDLFFVLQTWTGGARAHLCGFTHRLTLADISVFRVTGYGTCPSVFTRRVLATIEHGFTAFAWKHEQNN